jgi:hypothetical protein
MNPGRAVVHQRNRRGGPPVYEARWSPPKEHFPPLEERLARAQRTRAITALRDSRTSQRERERAGQVLLLADSWRAPEDDFERRLQSARAALGREPNRDETDAAARARAIRSCMAEGATDPYTVRRAAEVRRSMQS